MMGSKIRSMVRQIERSNGISRFDYFLPEEIGTEFREKRNLCPKCPAAERKRMSGESLVVDDNLPIQ
jgi:hypothetical protein